MAYENRVSKAYHAGNCLICFKAKRLPKNMVCAPCKEKVRREGITVEEFERMAVALDV